MKKLFILLSILAITTPSYACGCGGPNRIGLLIFVIFIAFLCFAFPFVMLPWLSDEDRFSTYSKYCSSSLAWTALAGTGAGIFISSEILSPSIIWGSTLFCMFIIFLGFTIKARHKNTNCYEEPTN